MIDFYRFCATFILQYPQKSGRLGGIITKIVAWLNAFLWGAPSLLMILSVGLFLTIRLNVAQLRLLPAALKDFFDKLRPGKEDSGFQALCTALAATVGTGNLVGVAGAICLGGPGSVFWMWLCGIFGMVTKFAEATLAVRYRVKGPEGWLGGPMYVMEQGLGSKWRPMAVAYSLCGVAAAFGVGNAAQINAAVSGIRGMLTSFEIRIPKNFGLLLGLCLGGMLGSILLGGAGKIGKAAEKLVPFASAGYILLCLGALIVKRNALPGAVAAIVQGAFSPRAVTCGMIGSAFQALRIGCSRGVFTNEAGMGTAAIAHAGAEVNHPVRQGMMGILEVFLDTIVICTLTALVILTSGVPVPYGREAGAELTTAAFSTVYGRGAAVFLNLAMVLFALATVLGWSLYGGRCAQYLLGTGGWKTFVLAQTAMVVAGAVLDTALVWQLSETINGLMVIPNLITLAVLFPELHRLTKEYKKSDGSAVGGGNYADFHQRQPLRTLSHAKVPPSGCGSQERGQEDLSPEHRPA